MSRLQEFYPNCLHIRPRIDLEENDFVADIDVRTKDLGEVFTGALVAIEERTSKC